MKKFIDDPDFSVEAVACLAWLNSRPAGYDFRVTELQARFNLGDFKWRRVSRELKKHGLLKQRNLGSGTGGVLLFQKDKCE